MSFLSRRARVLNSVLVQKLKRLLRYVPRIGFGRQGALAATRRLFPATAHTATYQLVALLLGSSLIGVGVGLLTHAHLGLSPYDVLVSGLQPRIGLSFGQTVWAVSAAFFVLAAVFGQWVSRWGVAYTLMNGFAIDAMHGLINSPDSLVGRVFFVVAALPVLAAGISVVVHSGSTGGAFELLMRAGEERGKDRRVIRTSLEVGALLTGVLLGGSFGVATVAIALTIGPLLGLAGQALEDHRLGRSSRLATQAGSDPAVSLRSEQLVSS